MTQAEINNRMAQLNELIAEAGRIVISSGPKGLLRGMQAATAFISLAQEYAAKGLTDPPQVILRKLFEKLGATYIKLGQFIASSPSIFPDEYVLEFQKCLDQTDPVPYSVIKATIEKVSRSCATRDAWASVSCRALLRHSRKHRTHTSTHQIFKVIMHPFSDASMCTEAGRPWLGRMRPRRARASPHAPHVPRSIVAHTPHTTAHTHRSWDDLHTAPPFASTQILILPMPCATHTHTHTRRSRAALRRRSSLSTTLSPWPVHHHLQYSRHMWLLPTPHINLPCTQWQELGRPASEVFSFIDPQPLASASVAQVHSAILVSSNKEVVIKVAQAVSQGAGSEFFDLLVRNTVEALGAEFFASEGS